MNGRTQNQVLIVALVLTLAMTACSFTANIPVTQLKTGPTQKVELQVPMPEGSPADLQLNLEFLAGELKLAPGATSYLASGTATFNVSELEPKVDTSGASYTLRTGDGKIEGIPVSQSDLKNEWDLQLAKTPMSLNIKAGGYKGDFELGGLSLTKLAISEGGSDVTCKFSEPNLVEMSSFTYNTGASKATMQGLANANFEQMTFSSGAGDYTLRFNGELKRAARVTIDTGVSTVNIIVPKGASAHVNYEGGLSSVNPEGGWIQNGSIYTLSGRDPTITITVKMGVGTLNLKTE